MRSDHAAEEPKKSMGLENIEHIVVVMFENRSFDNLLGWLYDNETNPPKFNIPPQNPPVFEGLMKNKFFSQLDPASNTPKIYAAPTNLPFPSCPNPNQNPTPDPHEEFEYVTFQIFGKANPGPDDEPNMLGFLQNYATTSAGPESAPQIMQTFSPDTANVINDLARNFAVCDHWFAPVPSQTWPNRGFAHTGSSDGHYNNDDCEWYHIPTIFNVLQDQGKSWSIFSDEAVSLTYWQFSCIGGYQNNVKDYSDFKTRCQVSDDGDPDHKLPAYSFIEPKFQGIIDLPNDYHPPHNICRGENFLADVYQAVRNCPYRDKILLIVTFDEHGGCYDHVAPPSGAAPPDPYPVSRDGTFKFDRYGVRVPAIVVSSYVEPGTVFRADPGAAPYDHTSILATIRDWPFLNLDKSKFLPSPRIQAAPTLDRVLTRTIDNPNQNWPDITPKCTIDGTDASPNTPLNDLQKRLIAIQKNPDNPATVTQEVKQLTTYAHGAMYLQPDNANPPS